jgi:hypothetical protein
LERNALVAIKITCMTQVEIFALKHKNDWVFCGKHTKRITGENAEGIRVRKDKERALLLGGFELAENGVDRDGSSARLVLQQQINIKS